MLHLRWINHLITNQFTSVKSTLEYVEMDATKMGRLWVPDLYFPNEKRSSFFNVMTDNKMMRLHRNGTVDYTTRSSNVQHVTFCSLTSFIQIYLEKFIEIKSCEVLKHKHFGQAGNTYMICNLKKNNKRVFDSSVTMF